MRKWLLPAWTRTHLRWMDATYAQQEPASQALAQRLSRLRSDNPLITIVIPAFQEGGNLAATLSSLSELELADEIPVELIVVNDGSSDLTSQLLKKLGVTAIHHPANLGRQHARQSGLDAARGEFLFQADADTLYPPQWGKDFWEALQKPENAIVYGSHAFLPMPGLSRHALFIHELLGDTMRYLKRRRQDIAHINVHGFNSAFRTSDARAFGSYAYPPGSSEDGHMAELLGKHGRITACQGQASRVYTSSRRLVADGGLLKAIWKRVARDVMRLGRYVFSK